MTQPEKYDSLKADIPLPQAVHDLSALFAAPNVPLFVVGGAVRDYLDAFHHGSLQTYAPKDIDLATELPSPRVVDVLSSQQARRLGVKVFPKGEAFGVISALLGGQEYEIATFREEWYDPDGPGRRPDQVRFSTPGMDAQRRDLTINALFYDIQAQEIRDYNLDAQGRGQDLEDVRNRVVRMVGSPAERFREDKLRILRLVRFFSLYNPGSLLEALDAPTLAAIADYRSLAGVSPERIVAEFVTGLKKAKHPPAYLRNHDALALLPVILPELKVSLEDVDRIGACRNLTAVLAWLLRDNEPKRARAQLNRLRYPNDVSDAVGFLLRLYRFEVAEVAALLKYRDLYKQLEGPPREEALRVLRQDVAEFAEIAGKQPELANFMAYEPQVRAQDYLHLEGRAISQAMAAAEAEAYRRFVSPSDRSETAAPPRED